MVFAQSLELLTVMSQSTVAAYNTVVESMGLPKAYHGEDVNLSPVCCLDCSKPIAQACDCSKPNYDENGVCTNYPGIDWMCCGRKPESVCRCGMPARPANKFISLYAAVDVPGGSEEGGWWTNTINLEASHECYSEEEAEAIKNKIHEIVGKPPMSNDHVHYFVATEDKPGRSHAPKACTIYS